VCGLSMLSDEGCPCVPPASKSVHETMQNPSLPCHEHTPVPLQQSPKGPTIQHLAPQLPSSKRRLCILPPLRHPSNPLFAHPCRGHEHAPDPPQRPACVPGHRQQGPGGEQGLAVGGGSLSCAFIEVLVCLLFRAGGQGAHMGQQGVACEQLQFTTHDLGFLSLEGVARHAAYWALMLSHYPARRPNKACNQSTHPNHRRTACGGWRARTAARRAAGSVSQLPLWVGCWRRCSCWCCLVTHPPATAEIAAAAPAPQASTCPSAIA